MVFTTALVAALAAQAARLAAANTAVCNTGGSIIGISLDSSGSVASEFPTARSQVTAFIHSTSGAPNANDNLYYYNTFSSSVVGTTGKFMTNDGGQVTDAIDAIEGGLSGTDITDGIMDLEDAFLDVGAAEGLAIVITDGQDRSPSVKDAADALREQGITVVAVGIGSADPATLDAIASSKAGGGKLIFTGQDFDEIEELLVGALKDVDSDGDGVSDCEDGCANDPKKTDPGMCGCGVEEGTCGDDRDLDLDPAEPVDATDPVDPVGPVDPMGPGYGDEAGAYGV